jgi:hypothetical protein
MYCRIIAAALVGLLLPLTTLAQTPAPAPAAAAAPKVYVPGLAQFMNAVLIEHNKLWFAAKARNWELAAYELGEIKEVMSDVQDAVPVFKNIPLAQMLDAVITKEIVDLDKAVKVKDFKIFSAGYDNLNSACNACHQATENGFVVIRRPTLPAFTNQGYRPHK